MKKYGRKQNGKKAVLYFLLIIVALVIGKIADRNAPDRLKLTLYDNHGLMEQEILRLVPVGSPISEAKRVMILNNFACDSQTNGRLECKKDNSSFLGDLLGWLSNSWYVDFSLKKDTVTSVKVWVQPAD